MVSGILRAFCHELSLTMAIYALLNLKRRGQIMQRISKVMCQLKSITDNPTLNYSKLT